MTAGERVDVVIVGGGPTGLTAAHLCARLGLSAIVLERREGPQRSPAAHVVNARTFEIWRQAGVAMGPVLDQCLSPEEAGEVHWVTSLGGEVVGSLPFERQGDEMLDITPTPIRNLSQHRLEPLLLAPDLDVRYGNTWSSMQAADDGVVVEVEGPQGPYRIDARYLLAADGAASPVRRSLGIELMGPRTVQSFVMVHLAADFRSLVGDAKGVLYFLVDPGAGGPFVCHGADREWVYMHGWDPEVEPIEAFTEERCRDLVGAALADPTAEYEVLGVSNWHMSAQIAATYRRDRTFLVGDAAHRFPPTGGLGLNTGVADVHNLVWKIAAVDAGWADPSILDSYESERRPVARFNCDQSLANAFKLIEVPIAFGVIDDPDDAARIIAEVLADPVRRAVVEQAIAGQAIHFDLLGLQLGHVYDGPLVVDDVTEAVVLDEPARDYLPSTRPGGRLPHGWLDDGTSTLDLVDLAFPTVLLRDGTEPPAVPAPAVARTVDAGVWDRTFGIDADLCLLVRPDQHVAARCSVADVVDTLERLFPATGEVVS
jgi:2-polyprenyl-6-methoxyphenol hydroxylase-like FAD-dependent oxidoreductase